MSDAVQGRLTNAQWFRTQATDSQIEAMIKQRDELLAWKRDLQKDEYRKLAAAPSEAMDHMKEEAFQAGWRVGRDDATEAVAIALLNERQATADKVPDATSRLAEEIANDLGAAEMLSGTVASAIPLITKRLTPRRAEQIRATSDSMARVWELVPKWRRIELNEKYHSLRFIAAARMCANELESALGTDPQEQKGETNG